LFNKDRCSAAKTDFVLAGGYSTVWIGGLVGIDVIYVSKNILSFAVSDRDA
jgi:hypothetical protein